MKSKLFATAVLIFFVMALAPNLLQAKVKGVCSDCHTMHNSQDGIAMAVEWDSVYGSTSADNTPNNTLLRYAQCLGCHKGTYNITDKWPMVWDDTNATATNYPATGVLVENTISAGGNFAWVEDDDTFGHNIASGDPDDTLHGNPPGYNSAVLPGGSAVARFGGTPANTLLTCAGVNGCHGSSTTDNQFEAIAGGHHGDSDALCDGTTVAKSYRFLLGIQGIEDADWEYTKAFADDHNQYRGVDRTNANAVSTSNPETISYLCCQCHGDFHVADTDAPSASPWVRHPTDFDMGRATGSEYAAYNEAADPTIAPYSLVAPVGSDDAGDALSTVKGTVNVSTSAGTAIVTCISCHRAHGSPFADILRWDYSIADAASGAGNKGCFICHTTKDDI